MSNDVGVGKQLLFEVQCFNAGGHRVTPSDCTVGVDPTTLGTDTINSDGTNGVFTAGSAEGSGAITARAGGVDAIPLPINVVDNTIASVVIVPL
jgi:hypothetical protein